MQYKVDLHTHSILSYDGGLTTLDYTKILRNGILDAVAVTDHNDISFAVSLKKQFGEKIIVGEEIKTLEGEVIGLFLQRKILPGLTVKETMFQIHKQNGLVYIPHPFELQRNSLKKNVFEKLQKEIDICEIFNGRSFGRQTENDSEKILKLQKNKAASSDAHCAIGIGRTYSIISDIPTRGTLCKLLQTGSFSKRYASFFSYVCPFVNKLRKKIHQYE